MAEAAHIAARALAEVVPRMARMMAVALRSDPSLTLTLRQYRMLERLSSKPHRTSELASSSDVSQPTATMAISSLEGRHLVERGPDPGDGRATLIKITDEGRLILSRAREQVLELLNPDSPGHQPFGSTDVV